MSELAARIYQPKGDSNDLANIYIYIWIYPSKPCGFPCGKTLCFQHILFSSRSRQSSQIQYSTKRCAIYIYTHPNLWVFLQKLFLAFVFFDFSTVALFVSLWLMTMCMAKCSFGCSLNLGTPSWRANPAQCLYAANISRPAVLAARLSLFDSHSFNL